MNITKRTVTAFAVVAALGFASASASQVLDNFVGQSSNADQRGNQGTLFRQEVTARKEVPVPCFTVPNLSPARHAPWTGLSTNGTAPLRVFDFCD